MRLSRSFASRASRSSCARRLLTPARTCIVGAAACCAFANAPATAQSWRVTPSITVRETFSDNVNFAPAGQEKSDLITELSPRIAVNGGSGRLKLTANYALTGIAYASQSNQNRLQNSLSALAKLEAVPQFFFVDAGATIQQALISPLGPTEFGTGNVNSNRAEYRTFFLTPYIQGVLPSQVTYLLRNNNTWTSSTGAGAASVYSNEISGRLESQVRRFGWSLDASRRETSFSTANAGSPTFETYRGRLIYQVDPQLRLYATGGYEQNNFARQGAGYSGLIYGGGTIWTPTPRTNLTADYTKRFFGPSYAVRFSHRTPLSAFSLGASRDISTTPQELLTLPAGNTAALLDAAFTTRIPDQVQRAQAVQDYLLKSGLPATLTAPTTFFANRVYQSERIDGSFALIGARNTLTFAAFWSRSASLSESPTVPVADSFSSASHFTTLSESVAFSHQLSALSSVTLRVSHSDTKASSAGSVAAAGTMHSKDDFVTSEFTTRLGPKTSGGVGVRYRRFSSDSAGGFIEHAAFATLTHTF